MPVSLASTSTTTSSPTASTASTARTPGCVALADVFTDPLMENPPTGGAPAADRRRYERLVAQTRQACLSCPMVAQCLYRAVVEHDVAGYVAGTTERQRQDIRRRLGVVVEPEDFDTLAGVVGGHRQIDHDEVVRLRKANPHESLDRLAQRLGCSLSTVKRHLRKERSEPGEELPRTTVRPSLAEVIAVAAIVLAPGQALAA